MDHRLGLGTEGYSPRLLRKIVRQGARGSFKDASDDLKELLNVEISPRHVGTITERIGKEWQAKRDQEVSQYQRNELSRMYSQAPACAAAMLDGGRLQCRAEDHPPGVFDPHWKEPKYANCFTIASKVSEVDPHPEPPKKFLREDLVAKLTKEIHQLPKTNSRNNAAFSENDTEPQEQVVSNPSKRRKKKYHPRKLLRSCVATMESSERFGWLVATEVYRRGLDLADRKACVCDGQKYNWSVWEEHLKPLGFKAILDFLHLLSYLYAAAQATRLSDAIGAWQLYEQWLRWAWAGQVDELLKGLQVAQQQVGLPPKDVSKNDPRKIVSTTLGYVENSIERMDYPTYRKLGLPISSAPIESMIKQMNKRVKGTDKFWHEQKAEAVLQICCAQHSEDNRVNQRWNAPRPYQRAVTQNLIKKAS